ncbi:MAG: glycine--tRNA ligase [Armatimonadetes bacterium]|nr:glycine--tRNA ligase [Armatimonadota bacterium]
MADMDAIVNLCKKRGFIFQSSEIYGGLASTWDYGPLGVELKRNVKDAWWRDMIATRDDVVGLDAAILMHPKVWETSGHVANFTDPLIDCKQCKMRYRADDVEGDKCPACGGELTEARQFNCMFKTHMGPLEDSAALVYMRPETAQGIFVNFLNVQQSTRKKLPFGIGQIGKSFRNEITPGNFTFRTREFEQMEMEFFCMPGTDDEWFDYWVKERHNWYIKYGMKPENIRLRAHDPKELAFYSKGTTDMEYKFPFGWGELEGVANRTNYDLTKHSEGSGKDLSYFDEATGEHVAPYVIEPAAGADRAALAFLIDSYEEEILIKGEKKDKRTVLHLHKDFAPVKAAVLPLLRNRPEIVEIAKKLTHDLQRAFPTMYDDTAGIGRLYRRQDEIGTLWCITVDVQTVEEDNQVTIRDRDTMEQIRMPIEGVKQYLRDQLESPDC